MSTSRPFAYNPGSVLSGTTQYGTLAVGVDPNLRYDLNYGGLRWWMGPDEDLGFCIGTSVPSNDQPTQPGIIPPFGNVQFWGTLNFDDSSFISLANQISGQNFTNSFESATWLNNNGYWTSYGGVSPTLTPTISQTPTVTPTVSETPSPSVTETPTPTPTPTSGDEILIDPIITETDEYIQVSNDEYLMFVDPAGPVPTPTPTSTQSETPTPTPTSSEIPLTPTPTPTQGVSGNFNVTISQVGPDVIWSGLGSFDLSALTSTGTGSLSSGFDAGSAIWAIGTSGETDTYSGVVTYPTTFGIGGIPVTSSSGSIIGILPGPSGRSLFVPSGYVSNTNISGSATYESQTISGMGLTSGTYTWSWGSGGNTSTLVMTIE